MSDPTADIQVATAYLLQTSYLVGVFYQSLKDQNLPDSLIEGLVRDWHMVAMEAEEFIDRDEDDA